MITAVQIGNTLYALTEGEPLPINIGQTLEIFYAFKYKMPVTADIRVWASLYGYVYGILARQGLAQTKQEITLGKALEKESYEGKIDVVVGEVNPGVYGLICELPDYDIEDHIDDCIEVVAIPSIWEMMGPLLVLGLMMGMVSMMMPAMK